MTYDLLFLVSFEELASEYVTWARARKAATTLHRERSKLKHLKLYFKTYQLTKFNPRNIERYMEEWLEHVKERTVNLELALLRHMLTKAVDWGYLQDNPAKRVKPFKEPPGRMRYLTHDECTILLNACKLVSGLHEIVLAALETGMRKSELLNLMWNAVDFTLREIVIRHTKNGEVRYVPISNALLSVLEKLALAKRSQWVFLRGDPYHIFIKVCHRIGIFNFRFHDLRHTFASHLVMAGVDLRTVQELMGHKTIQMTMRYSHLSRGHLLEAINKRSPIEDVTFTPSSILAG